MAAAIGAQAGGTIIQAQAARAAGEAQQNEANYEAAQLRNNADEQQAAAEQKMQQDNLRTQYVLSNARAAAAGSGGTATDPTVETDLKMIAGEGRYRALTDMYQGNSAANQLNAEATAKEYGGNLAAQAGKTNMFSTILSGASSLYQKYGTVSSKYGPGSAGGNVTVSGIDDSETPPNGFYQIPLSSLRG